MITIEVADTKIMKLLIVQYFLPSCCLGPDKKPSLRPCPCVNTSQSDCELVVKKSEYHENLHNEIFTLFKGINELIPALSIFLGRF